MGQQAQIQNFSNKVEQPQYTNTVGKNSNKIIQNTAK